MRLSQAPLTRLRWGFISLGGLILVAVGGLLTSALSRLEQQRQLRHQMVAERVFDEAEREIGSLLRHEAQRPGSAYDAPDTDPARWSTFVVGYYRRTDTVELLGEGRLPPARAHRVRQAVDRARTELDAHRDPPQTTPATLDDPRRPPEPLAPRSSPDVLRMLNRSVKVRQRRQRDLTDSFAVIEADAETLVLERQSDDRTRREGLVVDVPRLVETIEAWIVGAQGLRSVASLSTHPPEPADVSGPQSGYTYDHALAAPLRGKRIHLRLSRLDDADAAATLHGLAALLAVSAVLGLWALYRTVAVRVRFAERQNNFVSAVTHELRTPLTAIRMYGEMLREGLASDEATRHAYYDTIAAEGERLTRLINNVMEHGELRRGQRRAHLVAADLGTVVREVAELMAPHVEAERFALDLDLDPCLPPVQLDVDAFKQVLFNVIDNALKYGHDGETRRIRVEGRRAGAQVRVAVRDGGPGVAETHLQTVFEPFYRGEDELTRRQKGTGIGLSLARDLVELMGGRVSGRNLNPGFEVRITLAAAA